MAVPPVTSCPHHPGIETAARCEYCGQPYCGPCLTPLLGRRYCPGCAERVRSLAGLPEAAAPRTPGAGAAQSAAPAWWSSLFYLVTYWLLTYAATRVFAFPLVFAKVTWGQDGVPPGRGGLWEPAFLMHPARLDLWLWSALWGLVTWGTLAVVLIFTTVTSVSLERRRLLELLGVDGLPGALRHRQAWGGLLLGGALALSAVGIGMGAGWYVSGGVAPLGEAARSVLLGAVLLAPLAVGEELAFRGYLFAAVERLSGPVAAVALTGCLSAATAGFFSPALRENPAGWLGLVFFGLYLGWARLLSGSVWLPMVLRTVWLVGTAALFGLPAHGMQLPFSVLRLLPAAPPSWCGGTFGPEASVLLGGLLLAQAGVLFSARGLLSPTPDAGAAVAS
jgi:membrane protease YdiL (CAAX protease family)